MRTLGVGLGVLGLGLLVYSLWWNERSTLDDAERTPGVRDDEIEAPILVGAPDDGSASTDGTPDGSIAATETTDRPSSARAIRGSVEDPDARPVSKASVQVNDPAGNVAHTGTSTDDEGRFAIGGLPSGVLYVGVYPRGDTGLRNARKKIEADTHDVRFVLERIPYVDLVFVDAETGRGLRTRYLQIFYADDEGEAPRVSWSTDQVPQDPEPFKHRLAEQNAPEGTRIQLRALGYEPSPWIDAPTTAETEPRVVEVRHDPNGMALLRVALTLEPGEDVSRIQVRRMDQFGWTGTGVDIVDGTLTVKLSPGKHRIGLNTHDDLRPSHPSEWLVPVVLEVEVDRGGVVDRDVTLVRGGFVRLPLPEGYHDGQFSDGKTKVALGVWGRFDKELEKTVGYAGPLTPGTWSYKLYHRDGAILVGSIEIVAGEIVDSEPTTQPKADDD